jgi:hypothetical protein
LEAKKIHRAINTDLKTIITEAIENALGRRDRKPKRRG